MVPVPSSEKTPNQLIRRAQDLDASISPSFEHAAKKQKLMDKMAENNRLEVVQVKFL